MFNFFNSLNRDNLSDIKETVNKINSLEEKVSSLSEREIKERINSLIQQYQVEQKFDNILCESFALTREASKRVLGLRHFDTQLMGGIVLHNGQIAEMKTGEGKTLVGTLPVVLNALALKGVHVVTVNDYLAKRDKQWMSQLYRYLGLSVGLIQENMTSQERRKNYTADITYVTNSELAFDYLRDNMASSVEELVLRDFNYCIIDEVDSILIDEARTPLIISGNLDTPIEKYVMADEVTKYLDPTLHYKVDEKAKNITLTDRGIKQVETLLNVPNLYEINDPWIPFINNAIKAKVLFIKDTNYIVRDNEIVIIDEFTGRIMADRRWGDGLHQAVEAKERVPIKKGSETLGSITYQNFFLAYPKLAGMTGTIKTAEAEIEKIYKREVLVLPTAKKLIRDDLSDLVYKDEFTKWKFIAVQCDEYYRFFRRPVLIGTTSIEKSEIISQLLTGRGIPHRLLNAKPDNVKRESEIIAQAGRLGAVTVATNMAGRGTDILLGGNPDFQTRQQIFSFLKYLGNAKSYPFTNSTWNEIKVKLLTFENNSDKKQFILQTLENMQYFNALKVLIKLYNQNTLPLEQFNEDCQILTSSTTDQIDSIIVNIKENGYVNTNNSIDLLINTLYSYFYPINKKTCDKEKLVVQKLGGLYVIGTERHESRRIDNQLRGRAGRQGDPGTSRFIISLDDNLFRIFGGDQIKKMMSRLQLDDDTPLEADFLTKTLDSAQTKVEDYYYDSRKRLFDYDDVINTQRLSIYRERKAILQYSSVRSEMMAYGEDLICTLARELKRIALQDERTTFMQLNKEISYLLGLSYLFLDYQEVQNLTLEQITQLLLNQFWLTYDLKEAEFETATPGLIRLLEKSVLLNQIDLGWKTHLQKADILRETIGWRGYGQLDPLREYKTEGFNLFVETIREIKYNSVYDILKSQFP
jgi:preprotein translocase subunit SecA